MIRPAPSVFFSRVFFLVPGFIPKSRSVHTIAPAALLCKRNGRRDIFLDFTPWNFLLRRSILFYEESENFMNPYIQYIQGDSETGGCDFLPDLETGRKLKAQDARKRTGVFPFTAFLFRFSRMPSADLFPGMKVLFSPFPLFENGSLTKQCRCLYY